MEYVLFWRQSPILLILLKEKENKTKRKMSQTPSNWDLLSSLLPSP
jgi:hypothetical protein